MATGDNTIFEKETVSAPLQFRWFTFNCTQLLLPDNTSILIDPCLPTEDDIYWGKNSCGYTEKDIDHIDYILINHAHGDHIGTLDKVYQKHHPTILCHPIIAMELCEKLDIPYSKIVPIDNDQSYDFGSFRLETYLGQHVRFMKPPAAMGNKPMKRDPRLLKLGNFGTMFNTNFIITTPNGTRVGFGPGLYECLQWGHWNEKNIDVFMRQYYPADRPIVRRGTIWSDFADELEYVGAPVAIPIHHEMTYWADSPYDDMNEFAQKVNEILTERGSNIRMLNPERGKWYKVTFSLKQE